MNLWYRKSARTRKNDDEITGILHNMRLSSVLDVTGNAPYDNYINLYRINIKHIRAMYF